VWPCETAVSVHTRALTAQPDAGAFPLQTPDRIQGAMFDEAVECPGHVA